MRGKIWQKYCSTLCKIIIDKKGLCRAATHLPPNMLKSRKKLFLACSSVWIGPEVTGSSAGCRWLKQERPITRDVTDLSLQVT